MLEKSLANHSVKRWKHEKGLKIISGIRRKSLEFFPSCNPYLNLHPLLKNIFIYSLLFFPHFFPCFYCALTPSTVFFPEMHTESIFLVSVCLFDVNSSGVDHFFNSFFPSLNCPYRTLPNIFALCIQADIKRKNLFHHISHHLLHDFFLFFFCRYKNLNNAVVTRGKVLHAAVHSLQSFDKSLDQVSNDNCIKSISLLCAKNRINKGSFFGNFLF